MAKKKSKWKHVAEVLSAADNIVEVSWSSKQNTEGFIFEFSEKLTNGRLVLHRLQKNKN